MKWAFIVVHNLVGCVFDITMESINIFGAVLFYTCVILLFGDNFCGGEECNNDLSDKPAAVRLSNHLFCGYNTNVRPVKNQTTQTNVNVTFFLTNLHMNEDWDVLQISVQLYTAWVDEFIKWEPSQYDNIDRIHENSNQIWMPDIFSLNEGFIADQPKTLSNGLPSGMARINYNGRIQYIHRVTFNSHCKANIKSWPFDSHNCTLYIGSMLYRNDKLNFTLVPNVKGGFNLQFFESNREWKLKTFTHNCVKMYYTKNTINFTHCIPMYSVTLQRFSSMYYSSVIIPLVVISSMRTFTFLISLEYLIRIILLSLFFISELLYVQFLDLKLPNNGENPVNIVLLCRNSLVLTAVAIAMNVVSNELYKRGAENSTSNRPEWIKSVSALLLKNRFFAVLTKFNTQGSEHLIESDMENVEPANIERNENSFFWKRTSVLLDRLTFLIILILTVLNFMIYLPNL